MRESRISPMTADELWPWSSGEGIRVRLLFLILIKKWDVLNAASITLISVAVVSRPVKAAQSLTTRPAPMTSEPRLTVPA